MIKAVFLTFLSRMCISKLSDWLEILAPCLELKFERPYFLKKKERPKQSHQVGWFDVTKRIEIFYLNTSDGFRHAGLKKWYSGNKVDMWELRSDIVLETLRDAKNTQSYSSSTLRREKALSWWPMLGWNASWWSKWSSGQRWLLWSQWSFFLLLSPSSLHHHQPIQVVWGNLKYSSIVF